MMRWDLINALLDRCSDRIYLEIGTGGGKTGARVKARSKWGVDPNPECSDTPYDYFIRTTSDYFFGRLFERTKFDVVFVDGLHHAEQAYRDVLNALNHLRPGGAIVLHDCNPQTEAAQAVPRQQPEWNGDVWKTVVRLRIEHPELDVFVIDADHGLGVVRAVGRKEAPPLRFYDDDLSWPDLTANRKELLGLVSPKGWEKRL